MAEAKTARKTVSKPAKAKAAPAPAVALVAETPAVPAPVALPKSKDPVMNAEALAKPFEAVAPAMEKVAADIVAQTQAAQEQMSAKVKDMMEKNMKSMTEMTEFAKGNVEALIESAKAAAAGAGRDLAAAVGAGHRDAGEGLAKDREVAVLAAIEQRAASEAGKEQCESGWFFPVDRSNLREPGVAVRAELDFSDFQTVGNGHGLAVNLLAADDEGACCGRRQF